MPLQAGLSRGANCSELVLKTFERNPHGNRAFSLHRTLVQRLRCAAHPRVSAWLHVTTRPPQIPNATPWRCVAPERPPWRRRPQPLRPQFGGRNRLRPQSVAAHTYIHQTVAATNCGRSVCDSALILALVPAIRSAPPRPVPRMACRPALTKSSCEQKTPTT